MPRCNLMGKSLMLVLFPIHPTRCRLSVQTSNTIHSTLLDFSLSSSFGMLFRQWPSDTHGYYTDLYKCIAYVCELSLTSSYLLCYFSQILLCLVAEAIKAWCLPLKSTDRTSCSSILLPCGCRWLCSSRASEPGSGWVERMNYNMLSDYEWRYRKSQARQSHSWGDVLLVYADARRVVNVSC